MPAARQLASFMRDSKTLVSAAMVTMRRKWRKRWWYLAPKGMTQYGADSAEWVDLSVGDWDVSQAWQVMDIVLA